MAEQAFLLDVSQHQIRKIAHLQVYKEHSMFQLHILRPFIPHLRHTCSLMRMITLQGAPTSCHKWDSKQLITQSLPENILNLALPGAPNAILPSCVLIPSTASENSHTTVKTIPLADSSGELQKCFWILAAVESSTFCPLPHFHSNPQKQQSLQSSPNTIS